MRIDQDCFLRGCAWHDHRSKDPTVEVVRKDWVGLTEDEIILIVAECAASHRVTDVHFAMAIEEALKGKNA